MRKKISSMLIVIIIVFTSLCGCTTPKPGPDNINPVAKASSDETSGTTPFTVNFVGEASDEDGTIISWNWDFDDGSDSSNRNCTHTFQKEGTYYVKLTVTDNDGNTDSDTVTIQVTDEGLDDDGDGLSNTLEASIGTNPNDSNTDGDRYSDYDEYYDNVPTYVKSPGDDPLIPAYPEIEVSISDNYKIHLSQSIETKSGSILINDYTYSIDETSTKTTGWSNTLTVGGGFGSMGLGLYIEDQFTYSDSTTIVLSTDEQYKMSSAEEWSETVYTDLSSSYISTVLYIENIGTDAIESEFEALWLSLFIGDDDELTDDWTLGHDKIGAIIGNLKPGDSPRAIKVEFSGWMNSDLIKRIEGGEPVRIEIQSYDMGEDELLLDNAKANMVRLEIDTGEDVEKSFINEDDILLTDFLEEYADAVIDGNNIVNMMGYSNNDYNYWDVILPNKDNLKSFSTTRIYEGDHIVLIYNKDSDKDGILDRDEIIKGLNPDSDDTDNDGINDLEEVEGLYGDTNPLYNDSDFDGLEDGEEIVPGLYGCISEPWNNDTDDDGLEDGVEVNVYGTNPCDNDTDSDDIPDKVEIYWSNLDFDNFDPLSYNLPIITLYPIADTYINQEKDEQNFGKYPYMVVRNVCGGYKRASAMIKFDFSGIPENTTILSSNLKLYYYNWEVTNPADRILNCYRMIGKDWLEDEVTWDDRPDNSETYSSDDIPDSINSWMVWDVTDDSKDFVDDSEPNYGWKIVDNEEDIEGGDCPKVMFRTRDYTNSNYQPYLEIEIVP